MTHRFHRSVSIALLIATVAALVLGTIDVERRSRASAQRRASGDGVPNVVIIVMDTARQDRLSCYGHSRETSPRLSELARSAATYANAYSTSSWTAPGHASLFTGLLPVAHGATQEDWRLREGLTTVAEVLSEHGYRTVGIVENPMLARELGYAQGFAEYHEVWLPRTGIGPRNEALDRFLEAIDSATADRPFFLFVNLIEPHSPYNSSRQFFDRFLTDPSIGLEANEWREYYIGRRTFSEDELRHLRELYDAELLYTDHVVGEMADGLQAAGLLDDTVFIVTSDHGENIGDHGHMDHVFSLYETTTKVPLLIRHPSRFPPGSTVESPVQLIDLFPTVLAAAGIDEGAYPSDGRSLFREIPSDREIVCEYYYPRQAINGFRRLDDRRSPRLDPYRRRLRSLTAGGVKLIQGNDGSSELYDLADDPGESVNLAESPAYVHVLRTLEARLAVRIGERRPVPGDSLRIPDAALDEATKDALRSLGYLQ